MNGLILFAHGARDLRWAEPFERLKQMLDRALPQTRVSLAYLELMTPDLADAVAQMDAAHCVSVTIVPVFLGQGSHVRRDLPELIAALRQKFPTIELACAGAVGEDDMVLEAIARYCAMQLTGVVQTGA